MSTAIRPLLGMLVGAGPSSTGRLEAAPTEVAPAPVLVLWAGEVKHLSGAVCHA